jgi:hypothetical protein
MTELPNSKMTAVTESFIGVTETVKEIDPEAPTAPVLENGMPREISFKS